MLSARINKKKRDSPYFDVYSNLRHELFILSELNKQLPKTIEKMLDKREKEYRKSVKELDKKSKKEWKRFIDWLDNVSNDIKSKSPKPRSITVRGKAGDILTEIVNTLAFRNRFNMFIRDMSLVYLIAQFENFLQQTIEVSFNKKPEALVSCQKSITFEELLGFGSMDDVKERLIEKEISSILSRDIEDINKELEERFNAHMSRYGNWKAFKERFYRRNVLIHNSGIVNRFYRRKTGFKGKDKRLTVSQNYLRTSINMFDKMALEVSEHFYSKFG